MGLLKISTFTFAGPPVAADVWSVVPGVAHPAAATAAAVTAPAAEPLKRSVRRRY
jgi:hypothetical protein